MADQTEIRSLLRPGLANLVRLTGWKVWLTWLEWYEQRSRHGIYHAVSQSYGADWLERWSAVGSAGWLGRAPHGSLPVDPADAAAWCRRTCTPLDLDLADRAASGVFDLIGSGPRSLGMPPRWRTDLYTGIEWPLAESHRLRIVRGDGSDIRTVWELSRGYHFIALARAYWTTGDRRFALAFMEHVDSFIEQNPFGRGPHWASPMDAAIRGANWALAFVLFANALEVEAEFNARLLSNLYATGLYVERHREWHPVYRGNHYVANGVGLAYLGALFRDDHRGQRWLRRGARIIGNELLRQVHGDGVSFEASLGYHRLATQLFGWGAEIVRKNAAEFWSEAHESRLAGMHAFIETYTPPSGLAPMIGDADDGHLHVMDAQMLLEPRRHQLGLPARLRNGRAGQPAGARLYRDGGYAVLRHGDDHCIIRCGPLGLLGAGSHDHNDQLSFELVMDSQRIVRDSGTYCYTRDLQQRHRFRSTAAHNAIQLDGLEQNPIRPERPWRVLSDRTRAHFISYGSNQEELRIIGVHQAFRESEGAPDVQREIRFSIADRIWTVIDQVVPRSPSDAPVEVEWRLHLQGKATLCELTAGKASVRIGNVLVALEFPDHLELTLDAAPSSDRYGESALQPVIRLFGSALLPLHITTRCMPVSSDQVYQIGN